MLLKMTCKMNLTEVTPFLQWGDTLGIKKKKEKEKKTKYVASITILNKVLFFFHPCSQKLSLRKFNLALIHQATLVSLKTSNFKIKYSFDFQVRSREQGSLWLSSL